MAKQKNKKNKKKSKSEKKKDPKNKTFTNKSTISGFNFFDKIFIINLKDAVYRREHMKM
jgi:hypothetical protein